MPVRPEERKLAAILAADVVGYSRLMGGDEAGTLARLKEHRRGLIDPKISKHKGRIVKTTGDGILIEFPSVVEAVACAVAVQRGMTERNAATPEEQRIVFRVGVNLGDIIIAEDLDIHGDGVNVAARLEGIAEPGGICVSAIVHDQVRDKLDLAFEDLGEQALKNITRPVRAYRVRLSTAERAPTAAPVETTLALPDKPSIAVLPFQNMSGDPEQEYFADGMVEEIITALSRIRWLFVIARNSSFTYKGKAVDVKQVGRELGVRYVLEGSVRKGGNRVRITAQLIDAIAGTHVWADRYDRDLSDIFAVQDEITASVLGVIEPALAEAEQQRVLRKPPKSLGAWEAYQRGLWHFNKYAPEENQIALGFFRQAIGLDPNFAPGHYGYALALQWDIWHFSERPFSEVQGTPRDEARIAVSLDDKDAMAHAVLAHMRMWGSEWEAAISEARTALALNPNSAFVISMLGCVLGFGGYHDEALDRLQQAMRASPHDPLTWLWTLWSGAIEFYSRKFDAALETFNQLVRLRPEHAAPRETMAGSLAFLGRLDEAQGSGARRVAASRPALSAKTALVATARLCVTDGGLAAGGGRNPMTLAHRLAAILADRALIPVRVGQRVSACCGAYPGLASKKGRRPMRLIAVVLGALLALSSTSVRADELQVTVASGALSGFASRDGLVRSFKGIPYAAPPVGALRWRPPQAVTAWQGTREANRFASICPQPGPIPGAFYQREFFQTAEAQSEDCLYLNVWTAVPAGADPRPVMVFFHSGGNSLWSGSMPVYDGTNLARKGTVVVTINYRLGPFGFLAHPELDTENPNHVSGNYGLLDQQAALRWVKANIAAFGGDPERVTIFGQSAGGTDVGYTMASPLAKGLFRRAIIESGGMFGTAGPPPTLASAEEGGKKLVTELGAPSIAALRDMPAAQITAHIGRKFAAYGLRPVIDGWVLPRNTPEAIATGQQNATELLLGSVANEGTQLLSPTTPEALRAMIKQWFGTQADPIVALYTGTDPDTATVAQDQLMSDYVAAMDRVAAGLFARQGRPAWVYSFNRAAPGSDPVKVGAFHCAELVYVFGTLHTVDRPWEAIDRQLSDVMSSYWVRFAATGNPNGPDLPEWPAYDEQSRHVQEFGSRVGLGPGVKAAPLFEAYLSSRLPPAKQ